jgi:hypothetical protein
MAELETSTIVVLVIFSVMLVVGIIVLVCVVTHREAAKRQEPSKDTEASESRIYFNAMGPQGKMVTYDIDLDGLRGESRRRLHVTRDPTVQELAVVLNAEVLRMCPQHVLGFHDPVAHVSVELDLEAFLANPDHVKRTANVPLVALPIAKRRNLIMTPQRTTVIDVPSADSNTPRRQRIADSMERAIDDGHDLSPALQATGRDILDPPSRRLPLVTPRIYPPEPIVTVETPIRVSANRYVDVNTRQLAILSATTVALLDSLYFRWRKARSQARSMQRGDATVATVHESLPVLPGDHGLMVASITIGEDERSIVACVPGRVRVCWKSEAVWREYDRPLKLEVGRWCLRAEATNMPAEHHLEPKASSRVFTVQHDSADWRDNEY